MITKRHAMRLRKAIVQASVSLPDEVALDAVELYPAWEADTAYKADERIRYEGILYRCVQAHTSQEGWEPPNVPALWAMVSLDEWPEWVQPTGAQDAYSKGDKVSHNGKHWISTADANVWEPGVYGWDEVAT